MSEIIKRIFVGDLRDAKNYDLLQKLKVTHVVNCCVTDLLPKDYTPFANKGIKYALLKSDDTNNIGIITNESENPSSQWPSLIEFITKAYDEGGVILIHCFAGMNRSVTTTAIWLCLYGVTKTLDEALEMIKILRPVANPRPSYILWAKSFLATMATSMTPTSMSTMTSMTPMAPSMSSITVGPTITTTTS